MNTISLPKTKYRKILQNQSDFARELRQLKSVVETVMADEVNDRTKKRLEKISQSMDQGEGKSFKSMKEFRKYLKLL